MTNDYRPSTIHYTSAVELEGHVEGEIVTKVCKKSERESIEATQDTGLGYELVPCTTEVVRSSCVTTVAEIFSRVR